LSWTVLNVGYPFAPISPDTVGGCEQVLSHLDAALVQAGHRSIVIGCEGSRIAGTLIEVPVARGVLDDDAKARGRARHAQAVTDALDRFPVDLVHMHGIDFHAYLPPPGVPVLATLHLPLAWYPAEALSPERPGTWLNCVSHAQAAGAPASAAFLPAVPNGVPVDRLAGRHAKRGFALQLARICPEKGIDHALDAARRADVPLLIGGEVFPYPEHQAYFAEQVAPRLDARRRFLGPLPFARKRRLLSAARCLLVPSLAAETSSLVAMEALACGTPVIAYPSGALPEIVEHGRTGFIVRDVAEMAQAIRAAEGLEPDTCRRAARERFSDRAMAERYFALYARIIGPNRNRLQGAA
jgi:glycosyltransferase involved in cell wall biosynthesis